jgi:hypothetical protein
MKEMISDHTVVLATDKTWNEWYAILDSIGAKKMTHTEIARYLYLHYLNNNGWWCQMITNRYEKIRGMKKQLQKKDGFQISISKVMNIPVTDMYEAWVNESVQKKWLREKGFEITTITPNTSIKMIWNDSQTHVSVNFYEKGSGKSQIVVEHSRLMQESDTEKRKKYWKEKLERLSKYFATPTS